MVPGITLLKQAAGALATLVYPPSCANCQKDIPPGEYLCAACLASAKRIKPPFCRVCSEPFDGALDETFVCSNCAHRSFAFSCAVSAYRSRGIVRELVHRFKYEGETHLRRPLGRWIVDSLEDPRIRACPCDFLVPVPLHPVRLRTRGFNQAEVLAQAIAKAGGLPVLNCLKRVRNTSTQTRLDREQRMENLRNAFQMRKSRDVRGKHLILVDDVFTTGSTAGECARVLSQAGASSIRVMTIARG